MGEREETEGGGGGDGVYNLKSPGRTRRDGGFYTHHVPSNFAVPTFLAGSKIPPFARTCARRVISAAFIIMVKQIAQKTNESAGELGAVGARRWEESKEEK